MCLDERAEPGLPKNVRQASVAVQFMIALDQTPALRSQALRQEAEIEILSLAGEGRIARVVRNHCHDFYRPASRWLSEQISPTRRSITIRGIYLRWIIAAIFIEKK
jgi:hypothetical protein